MKDFVLGLCLGAVSGAAASFCKDKDGQRLGTPLRKNFIGLSQDWRKLALGTRKARQAGQRLQEEWPQAKRTISDLRDESEHFQEHLRPKLAQMQEQVNRINRSVVKKQSKD